MPVACSGKQPPEEDERRRRTLRRISRWVTGLIGHADLTPSDAAMAMILVATLQRRARRHVDEQGVSAGLRGLPLRGQQ